MPSKIFLTAEAVNHLLANNSRMSQVLSLENENLYGFQTQKIGPASLQSMIVRRYLSRIEFSRVDLLTYKNGVIDVTKLVVFALLYMRFEKQFSKLVYDSESVRRWNRTNPARLIDDQTRLSEQAIKKVLQNRKDDLVKLHEEILSPVLQTAREDSTLSDEERTVHGHLCRRYLREISPRIWYIFLLLCSGYEREDLIASMSEILGNYAHKSQVGEYLALIIVELMMHAEYTNMLDYARMTMGGAVQIEDLILNDKLREHIVSEMEKNDRSLFVSWNLAPRGPSIDRGQKLTVSIYNREWEFESVRSEVNDKMGRDMSHRGLMTFFQEAASSSFNTGLGLNYLSYLKDACKAVGIYFDSTVTKIPRLEWTMVTLLLQF